MCCPLILCKEETMRGAELNKIPKKEQKGGMMEK
jgi:hypothetical protein